MGRKQFGDVCSFGIQLLPVSICVAYGDIVLFAYGPCRFHITVQHAAFRDIYVSVCHGIIYIIVFCLIVHIGCQHVGG